MIYISFFLSIYICKEVYPPLLYVSCVCVCMYLFLSSLWQIENWICVFLFLSFVILFFVGVGVYGRMYMLMLYTVCMLIVWDLMPLFLFDIRWDGHISGSIFTIVIHFILSSYHSFFPLLYVLYSFYFILVFPIVIRVIFSGSLFNILCKWKRIKNGNLP